MLLAMIILTLVSTVAAGMVWQQARAVDVEAAERTRAQMLAFSGAGMDFVRGAIRQQFRGNVRPPTIKDLVNRSIGPAPLSSLIAPDRNNTLDTDIDAVITAWGRDAGASYNLRNLVDKDFKRIEAEVNTLRRLCEALGLASDVADVIVTGLERAWMRRDPNSNDPTARLAPNRPADLTWLGLNAETVKVLKDHVEFLPEPTPINANTASAPVLYAVIDTLKSVADASVTERCPSPHGPDGPGSIAGTASACSKKPFEQPADLMAALPPDTKIAPERVSLVSSHFHITVRLRYEDRQVLDSYLVRYAGPGNPNPVRVLRRERTFSKAPVS